MDDFQRINEPRTNRMLEQLGHIQKSAASTKTEQTKVNKLLTPVFEALDRLRATENREPERFEERPPPPQPTRPVAKEMTPLKDVATQQLVDRMIACGAELARRRQ